MNAPAGRRPIRSTVPCPVPIPAYMASVMPRFWPLAIVRGSALFTPAKQLSFVYDIADLYKAEITIPIAFQVAAGSRAPNYGTGCPPGLPGQVSGNQASAAHRPGHPEGAGISEADPAADFEPDADPALPTALWTPVAERTPGTRCGATTWRRTKMTVLILERVPATLRGELSRWMIEPRTGVFVGKVSAHGSRPPVGQRRERVQRPARVCFLYSSPT